MFTVLVYVLYMYCTVSRSFVLFYNLLVCAPTVELEVGWGLGWTGLGWARGWAGRRMGVP